MISTQFKIAGLIIAPCLVFGAGYFIGKQKPAVINTIIKERVVYQDRVIVRSEAKEEVSFKEQIVEKPDGTRITTKTNSQTKTAETEGRRDTKVDSSTRVSRSESTAGPSKPNYSLGINIKPTLNYKDIQNYSLEAGRRMIGPLWLQVTVDVKGNFTLGIRIEF